MSSILRTNTGEDGYIGYCGTDMMLSSEIYYLCFREGGV